MTTLCLYDLSLGTFPSIWFNPSLTASNFPIGEIRLATLSLACSLFLAASLGTGEIGLSMYAESLR